MSARIRAKLFDVLARIEEGAVTLHRVSDQPDDDYFGNVEYRSEDGGFSCVVFWDCGTWDYLGSLHYDGTSYGYDQLGVLLGDYRPTNVDAYRK